MKKQSIALALISAIVSTGTIAQLAQSQSVFYSNAGVDAAILFEGAALAPFQAETWLQTSATKVANPCGLVIFSTLENARQFVRVGSQTINYQSLPIQTIPVCTAGVLSEPRPSNFRTVEGRTVLVQQTGSVVSQYLGLRKRAGTFNACGFRVISIKNAINLGADSIIVNFAGQSTGMGDLNQAQSLPICKKVGSNFVKYIKAP